MHQPPVLFRAGKKSFDAHSSEKYGGCCLRESDFRYGGETETGISDVVEKYDLESDTWTKLSPMPVPLTEINSVVIGGLIYIPGGKTLDNQLSNTLHVYDPRKDQWDVLAPLPKPLCGYAVVAYEGRMYVFGGWMVKM